MSNIQYPILPGIAILSHGVLATVIMRMRHVDSESFFDNEISHTDGGPTKAMA